MLHQLVLAQLSGIDKQKVFADRRSSLVKSGACGNCEAASCVRVVGRLAG